MEYMLKVLNLQKEIDKLKVIDQNHIKYIDSKRRLKDINSCARKISEMDLKESDKRNLLKRLEEYKSKIEQYGKIGVASNNKKKSGKDTGRATSHTILSFLLGVSCLGLGIKLKDVYKLYKNRRMDEMANYIYEKLSGVELNNG